MANRITFTKESTLFDIRKGLARIPAKNWITNQYQSDEKPVLGCAVGHVNRRVVGNRRRAYDSPLERPLRRATRAYLQRIGSIDVAYADIANVNNEPDDRYIQESPKERVLALLDDMIEAGVTL